MRRSQAGSRRTSFATCVLGDYQPVRVASRGSPPGNRVRRPGRRPLGRVRRPSPERCARQSHLAGTVQVLGVRRRLIAVVQSFPERLNTAPASRPPPTLTISDSGVYSTWDVLLISGPPVPRSGPCRAWLPDRLVAKRLSSPRRETTSDDGVVARGLKTDSSCNLPCVIREAAIEPAQEHGVDCEALIVWPLRGSRRSGTRCDAAPPSRHRHRGPGAPGHGRP